MVRPIKIHIHTTFVMGQWGEDACGPLARPVPADGAVALALARGTAPLRVLEGLPGVLAVPVPKAHTAEGASHPVARSRPAHRLGVQCLLPALVARGPVHLVQHLEKHHSHISSIQALDAKAALIQTIQVSKLILYYTGAFQLRHITSSRLVD